MRGIQTTDDPTDAVPETGRLLEAVGDDRLDDRLRHTRPEVDVEPPAGRFGHLASPGEREPVVVDTGPYAIVRHPLYLASLILFFGWAFALGSFWALIPGAIAAVVLIVRTALEDRTLQKELEGYKEYADRVRYRLIPGVW